MPVPQDEHLAESGAEETPQVVNLTNSSAAAIQAELVRMHQSAAQTVSATEAELHQSVALRVAGDRVGAHEAALGVVSAAEAELVNSGAGAVRAEIVNINGCAGAVVTGRANLGNTYAGMVAAREVRGERIESLILLSGRVEGDIHTVVDTRGAIIAGLVGGLFAGLMLLLGRLLFGREAR